jgi:hypothetical protein
MEDEGTVLKVVVLLPEPVKELARCNAATVSLGCSANLSKTREDQKTKKVRAVLVLVIVFDSQQPCASSPCVDWGRIMDYQLLYPS